MALNRIIGSRQGVCPSCDSEDVCYGVSELEGEGIMFPITCNNCGFKGEEWYGLEFDGIYGKEVKNE